MFVRPVSLALAAVAVTAVTGTALTAAAAPRSEAPTPAASGTAAAPAKGRVVAQGGVTARNLPTPASAGYGTFAAGEQITLLCKIRGSSVDGNDLWYLVPSEGQVFVTARYVANVGAPPRYCDGGTRSFVGRTTTTLAKRTAPTTRAAAVGSLAAGTDIGVVCKLTGQSVAGNPLWYYLHDGRWISARYVTNRGAAPAYCS